MISGWSGPIWLVALYDFFDEDGLLFVWVVLCLLFKKLDDGWPESEEEYSETCN